MDLPLSPLVDAARLAEVADLFTTNGSSRQLLDQLTLLTATVLHVPTCLVSLVDDASDHIVSGTGLAEPWSSRGELPLEYSYCRHLVTSGEPLLIADARKHQWVSESPAIAELGAIAYAGIPVRGRSGAVLGGFCVIDNVPRSWGEGELTILRKCAAIAEAEMVQRQELRGAEHRREEVAQRFEAELSTLTRFRTLVENSLAGIYLLHGQRVLYANPRMREIFGFDPQESLSDLRISDLVLEEDRAEVENVRRDLESGAAHGPAFSFRGLRRDGSTVDVEVYGNRVEVQSEYAILGTLLDVTQRRRAEERLRESEERLRLVERATEDVIWEWEIRAGEISWNEMGAKIFRYMPGEVDCSVDWHQERIHPEDRERVLRRLQTTIGGVGEFWSEEYRFLRGDHQYATVVDRGIVVRNARGEPVRVIGSMMDVTERKRSEETQRFLARASALLDSSMEEDAVLPSLARLCVPAIADFCLIDLADEQHRPRRAASAHIDPSREETMLGDDEGGPVELWGRGSAKVLSSGEALFIPEIERSGLAKAGYTEADFTTLASFDVCSLIVAPLGVAPPRFGAITLGMAASGRTYTPVDLLPIQDLSRRVALTLDHARLYREATEAVQARDELLAVISHDLRNPLHAIQLSAEMLKDGSQDRRSENQRWTDIILKTSEQMNALIGDLLDLSRIQARGFAVDPVEGSVATLVGDARNLLEPLAAEKGIEIAVELPADLPTLWMDARQVMRVLSNILGNAIKFTPDGGSVRLKIERDDGDVLFSASDTGPGLSEEQLPNVFDRYWQARPGDRQGTGLGLSIARGIIEAHGGRIWVESREGSGATFSFTIPIRAG